MDISKKEGRIMAYKLQVTDPKTGVSFNCRYENLAKARKSLEVLAKNDKGEEVVQATVFQGQVLRKGSTQRKWVDANDVEYSKDELKFFIGDQEVDEVSQTKVFEIADYQDMCNYTDMYVMSAFYEVFPDDDSMKKDIDRARAEQKNKSGMYKLWKYLMDNNKVARAEFCPASRGFMYSDGYIRPVQIDDTKWGLEIGVFKEQKVFQHLQEGVPQKVEEKVEETTKKKIKMI
jgi:hypothetical protein